MDFIFKIESFWELELFSCGLCGYEKACENNKLFYLEEQFSAFIGISAGFSVFSFAFSLSLAWTDFSTVFPLLRVLVLQCSFPSLLGFIFEVLDKLPCCLSLNIVVI